MDQKPPTNPEIRELINSSAAARSSLEYEVATLRRRLDVPARVRESLKNQPLGWLLGSLASGLAVSFLIRRKPATARKPSGFLSRLLGLVLTSARPLVKIWLTRQLKQWVTGTLSARLAGTEAPLSLSNIKSALFSHVHTQGSRSR